MTGVVVVVWYLTVSFLLLIPLFFSPLLSGNRVLQKQDSVDLPITDQTCLQTARIWELRPRNLTWSEQM